MRLRALVAAAVVAVAAAATAFAALPQQAGTVDLSTQSNIRIDGAAAGSVFGEYATSAGDFDGDGVSDLVVTNANVASAWIIFGAKDSGNVSLASPGARAIKISGGPFHWAAGGQDVSGDGLADVILGDSATDSAYLIYGSKTHAAVDVTNLGTAGFKMTGGAGDGTGASVAMSPDMNGDGKAEMIVGAFGTGNNGRANSGSAYVVFGRTGTSEITLPVLGPAGFRIDGAVANHGAGSVVAGGGDVTGDGAPDVLVGAPGASFSFATAGAVYVVPGKASTTNVDLNACSTCFRIDGQRASDQLPRSLAITPDMSGDGIGEAAVGTDFADNPTAGDGSAGSAWVVFGKSSNTAVALASLGSGGFRIDGQKAGDQAARSLASVGDVNGDGKPDIAVGALFADNNGRSNSGSSYVVFGTGSTSTVSLDALGSAGYRIDGAAAGDNTGRSVGSGGDFNADARPDVITAGEFAASNGANSGSAYVVFGFGQPAFSYPGAVTGSVGTAITALAPAGVARTGPASFAIDPALPAGLALDAATGAISGTPTAAAPDAAYTVTMTDLAGSGTATVNVKVDASPVVPPPVTPGVARACSVKKTGTRRANTLRGTSAGDLIRGGSGNDKISGLGGDDCLFGQAGNDTLSGGAGKDKLDGGPGTDKLTGGKGKDTFTAGAGNDTINSKDGVAEKVSCGKGKDKVRSDKKDELTSCEKRT
jgi:Ca2+-binding RTX toxin-like protein